MDEKLPHVQDGEEFTAEAFNEAAARIERFLNLRVAEGASGGLTLYKDRYGMVLSYQPPAWTLATLSGSTSPYSWHEAAPASSGTWSNYGVRSGTSNAYEINGVAGLGGKVVRMWWTGAGDWRFAYPRRGSTPCTGGTGQICATITGDGCGTVLTGATITVKDHTGTTVGTCTTTGQVVSLSLSAGGFSYTNGTGYAIGFSGGGGSGAAGTFDVVGGAVTNLQLTASGSGYTSAPTLDFSVAAGVSGFGASATATVNGKCCIAIPSTGTYTVTSDVPGTSTLTTTINAICSLTANNVSFSYSTNSLGTLCFNASTCTSPCTGGSSGVTTSVPGATLSFTGAGTGSITAGSCMRLGVGSYTGTITYPSGATLATSFTITACHTTTVAATSISSFVFRVSYRGTCTPPCTSCSCNYTLTWAATGAPISSGTLTVPCVGAGGCGTSGVGCVEIPITDQFTNPNINYTAVFANHTFSGTMALTCGNVDTISYDTFGGNPNLC